MMVSMVSISLSEFNQNPARVRRLADKADVIVMRRGVPAYKVVRLAPPEDDPIQALRMLGKLLPRRRRGAPPAALPALKTDVDLGALLDADRGRFDG